MSPTISNDLPIWLNHFQKIDSTNNYAMQMVREGLAYHGQVIWADWQTKGKGQRGNTWNDSKENLKFTLIIQKKDFKGAPFDLNMLAAMEVVGFITMILPKDKKVAIKWPNDIFINDKKTCGILSEIHFLGSNWDFAVIGIGLNVNQTNFPKTLKLATSIAKESLTPYPNFKEIITKIRTGILTQLQYFSHHSPEDILKEFNQHLYRKGQNTKFRERATDKTFEGKVVGVNSGGQLQLQLIDQSLKSFDFGILEWLIN